MFEYEEIGPAIFLYKNIINNEKEIINTCLEKGGWRKAQIWDKPSSSLVNDNDSRNTQIFDTPMDYLEGDIWHEISSSIFHRVDHYAQKNAFGFCGMEPIQILRYFPGEGFYNPHFDDGPAYNRICSAVLYLNDVELGGETHFINFDLSVKPSSGNMIVFPANYAYIHEAKKPISEEKFAAVTWFGKTC
jgi:hypothetical protein